MDTLSLYCKQCGYDLNGLPAQGQCPECGQRYDILTGEGLSRGELNRSMARHWTIVNFFKVYLPLTVGLIILGLGFAGMIYSSNQSGQTSWGPLIISGMIAIIFLISALINWIDARREKRDREKLMQ